MRFCRLLALSIAFAGCGVPARAQYTSKSTTATPAAATTAARPAAPATANRYTSSTTATATAKPAANPYTGGTTAAAPKTTSANPYTGRTTTAATPKTTAAAAAQQQRPVFRPRPQPVLPATGGDDDLPSFDALESAPSAARPAAAATAQGSNLPPPPPPPKGEVWVYIADFQYRDLTGLTMNCTWKLVAQNKTNADISKLEIKYTLMGDEFPIYLGKIPSNKSKVTIQGMYSSKCPALTQVKPKVEVVSCKMGSVSGQDCSKYIVIK